MASPQLVAKQAANWCSIGPRAHLLTGFFLEWFKHHFSQEHWIEHPELRSRLWKAVDSTNLRIEPVYAYRPNITEKTPAILVARNDWQVEHRILDDRLQGDWDLTGVEHYARLVSGSHTLFCLSPLPVEAELLGSEVYREISQFAPQMRAMLDILRMVPVSVGKLSQLEEAPKIYVVPVTVAYVYMETWIVAQHGPVLKKLILSMFTQ